MVLLTLPRTKEPKTSRVCLPTNYGLVKTYIYIWFFFFWFLDRPYPKSYEKKGFFAWLVFIIQISAQKPIVRLLYLLVLGSRGTSLFCLLSRWCMSSYKQNVMCLPYYHQLWRNHKHLDNSRKKFNKIVANFLFCIFEELWLRAVSWIFDTLRKLLMWVLINWLSLPFIVRMVRMNRRNFG